MIGLNLLLMVVQGPWTPAEQVYHDLSHKLASGKFDTKVADDGSLTECKVTKSTGDADLDATFCESVRACLTPGHRDMNATTECMNSKSEELMRNLAAKRAVAKAAS